MSRGLLTVGATGSIGRHVVAVAVAEEGYTVRVLVRGASQAGLFPPGSCASVPVGQKGDPARSLRFAVITLVGGN